MVTVVPFTVAPFPLTVMLSPLRVMVATVVAVMVAADSGSASALTEPETGAAAETEPVVSPGTLQALSSISPESSSASFFFVLITHPISRQIAGEAAGSHNFTSL